jgi:hypothetical protein
VFLLPIFFNALLNKVFSTFSVFNSTDTLTPLTHHVVSTVAIGFRYGFASMTFDEGVGIFTTDHHLTPPDTTDSRKYEVECHNF